MRTETLVFDPRYPDCTLTSYIHDPHEELNISTRRAIIVCPGGGYQFLSEREGEPVALRYFAAGLNVFVLRYSIREKAAGDAPLIESALAVKYIRDHAEEYFVDPSYVFITGFSAGGHCAAMCATMWNDPAVREALGIDRGEAPEGINRPDGMVLCYPVIVGDDKFTHLGTRNTFCGTEEPTEEDKARFSIDLHVDDTTPPAFIWHTFTDPYVPVENSLALMNAMAKQEIPFEAHIYPHGVHGLSLCNEEVSEGREDRLEPHAAGWIDLAIKWINFDKKA